MTTGRIPAQTNNTLIVTTSLSRDTDNERYESIINDNFLSCQPLYGNKCGHNRKSFRNYSKPENHKRRFHVLEEGRRRILDALKKPFDYPIFHGLMFHSDKDGRGVRSERREAELSLLLPALLDTLNIHKMQCGYYAPYGDFINYTYAKFVQLTGMNRSRVERNMRHLQEAGIVTVHVIVGVKNDGYKTKRVIITVLEKAFLMLNLDREFLEAREQAYRNRAKEEKKIINREKYLDNFKTNNPKIIKSTGNVIKEVYIRRKAIYSVNKGKSRGQLIKDCYSHLESKGLSQEEIIKIIKRDFPPPS